jgi:hypothetical protein
MKKEKRKKWTEGVDTEKGISINIERKETCDMIQSKMVWPGTGRHQEMREVLEIKTLWEQRRNLRHLFIKSYKTETS